MKSTEEKAVVLTAEEWFAEGDALAEACDGLAAQLTTWPAITPPELYPDGNYRTVIAGRVVVVLAAEFDAARNGARTTLNQTRRLAKLFLSRRWPGVEFRLPLPPVTAPTSP